MQDGMFSHVTLEQRVREHPLREIRKLTDEVLRSLRGLYSDLGRRSIARPCMCCGRYEVAFLIAYFCNKALPCSVHT